MDLQDHRDFREAPFFAVQLREDGDHLCLELAGEVDLAARPELDALLLRAGGSGCDGVLVDLRQVTFLDSTGLHWLLRARDTVARAGATFEVAIGDGPVRDVLALSGIDRVLALASELPEE